MAQSVDIKACQPGLQPIAVFPPMPVMPHTQIQEKGHIRRRKTSSAALRGLIMLREVANNTLSSVVVVHSNISAAAPSHSKTAVKPNQEEGIHLRPEVDIVARVAAIAVGQAAVAGSQAADMPAVVGAVDMPVAAAVDMVAAAVATDVKRHLVYRKNM